MAASASLSPDERRERYPNLRMLDDNQLGRAGAVLAFITREEREVLELCFSGECTSSDITAKLQMPLGAIKAHLGRGLFGFVHALSIQTPASVELRSTNRRRIPTIKGLPNPAMSRRNL